MHDVLCRVKSIKGDNGKKKQRDIALHFHTIPISGGHTIYINLLKL